MTVRNPNPMHFDDDFGHHEVVTDWPHPSDRGPGLVARGWGLPAVSLTWGSMVTGAAVLVALQATSGLRVLLRLPVAPPLVALCAAAVAWAVAISSRKRPGRRLPRIWNLALAGASSAVAVLGWIDPDPRGAPWLHAVALAFLAAALALLPRLLVVRLGGGWAQAVVPVSLALAVVVALFPAVLLGRWAEKSEALRIEQIAPRIESWVEDLEQATPDGHWDQPDPRALESAVSSIETMDVGELVADRSLWRSAVFLGADGDMARVLEDLGRAVASSLDPARSPRLSDLDDEELVRWDPVARQWIVNGDLARSSALIGRYHRRLGELLGELDAVVSRPNAEIPASLRSARKGWAAQAEANLDETSGRWGDHWAARRVRQGWGREDAEPLPLDQVLGLPLKNGGDAVPAPADLWRLLSLRPADAVALLGGRGGCRASRYVEEEQGYLRIDCQDFATDEGEGHEGAVLRLEVRLVYSAAATASVMSERRPREVYLLVPVPAGRDVTDFRDAVAGAMASAVAHRWSGGLRFVDRSGSARHGFILERGGEEVVVYRPAVESFVDGEKAVTLRAVPR